MTTLGRADLKILRTLQVDGGVTNVELAERVGMSPSPCLRRVKQLEGEGVIVGYSARLDRRKLGLDMLAIVEVQVERHNEAAAEAFRLAIGRESAVIECYAVAGAYDYVLKVVAPNLDAFGDFTMNRLLRMPGVKEVRSSLVLDSVKDTAPLPLDHIAH